MVEWPDPDKVREEEAAYEGVAGASEHRTVGPHRAWCFQDREWCYPDEWCSCCNEVSGLEKHWHSPDEIVVLPGHPLYSLLQEEWTGCPEQCTDIAPEGMRRPYGCSHESCHDRHGPSCVDGRVPPEALIERVARVVEQPPITDPSWDEFARHNARRVLVALTEEEA